MYGVYLLRRVAGQPEPEVLISVEPDQPTLEAAETAGRRALILLNANGFRVVNRDTGEQRDSFWS